MKHTVSLKQNHLFRRLYAKGENAAGPLVAVYCRRNRTGCSRLGVTVSTKVGNAVVRNRVRRRIREGYRVHEARFAPGYDIVVVARNRCAQERYAALERDMLRQFGRLGLMKR